MDLDNIYMNILLISLYLVFILLFIYFQIKYYPLYFND
jgi:hypothetical protein